ncbi:hypothetical protein C0995_006330 [Termitomyces sp. Mi166|nr:hypothetical protein C0995_006330 [Termitomyces sp. Mi166\
MADKNQIHEKLEVEDEEARLRRIQSTLEKLNTSSPPSSFSLPTERSRPHAIPPSDLLRRAQTFLPEFAASNAAIEQQRQVDPSSVDIECIEEDAERYIEMNLGLGLFEQRNRTPDSTSDDDSISSDSSSEFDDTDSEHDEHETGREESTDTFRGLTQWGTSYSKV